MRITLVGVSHHRAPVALRERVALDLGEAAGVASTLAPPAANPSACRRVTARSSTSRTTPSSTRETPHARCCSSESLRSRRSTSSTTRRRRCTSSVSLRASTRSCRARARSSARCGWRSKRARRGRCWAGSSARRSTRAGAHGCRRRSARPRRRSPRRRLRSPTRCSATCEGAGSCSSVRARSASRRPATCFLARRGDRDRRQPLVSRAEELAGTFGASAIGLDRIDDELASADIVVVDERAGARRLARSGRTCARAAREAAAARRPGGATRPRSGDPDLSGCYLYDLDDLDQVVTQTLTGRRREAEAAERSSRRRRSASVRGRRRSTWCLRSRRCVRGRRRSGDVSSGGSAARSVDGFGAPCGGSDDRADREQAAAPTDGAHEGSGRCSRRGGLC